MQKSEIPSKVLQLEFQVQKLPQLPTIYRACAKEVGRSGIRLADWEFGPLRERYQSRPVAIGSEYRLQPCASVHFYNGHLLHLGWHQAVVSHAA